MMMNLILCRGIFRGWIRAAASCRGRVSRLELTTWAEKSVFNSHSWYFVRKRNESLLNLMPPTGLFWKTELDLVMNAVVSSQSSQWPFPQMANVTIWWIILFKVLDDVDVFCLCLGVFHFQNPNIIMWYQCWIKICLIKPLSLNVAERRCMYVLYGLIYWITFGCIKRQG